MSDEKISGMTPKGSAMSATDLLETDTGGITRSLTGQNIIDGVSSVVPNKAITEYVVDATGSTGYTTIQSAVNAANATGFGGAIYVRPGTYTENLTLHQNISIRGIVPIETLANDAVGTVILIGVHTPPTTEFFTFSQIILQSSTDIFNSSAAGAASLSLLECQIFCTDGYAFNLPNWTGALYANSVGDSSPISGFVNNPTGTSSVIVHNSHIGSFNSSKPMQVPGFSSFIRSEIRCPIITSGAFNLYYSVMLNATTFNNGCNALIYFSEFEKFGAPVINNNSSGGGGHIISMSTFNGFNNPIIGGSGTDPILIQGCTFFGSSTISGAFTTIYKPWTVPFGGTGISTATANGVILAGATSDGAFQVAAPGTAGQVLTSNGPGAEPTMQDNGSGSGDVVGPASATNTAIARYNGTTGKIIKDSSVTIADNGTLVVTANDLYTSRSNPGGPVAVNVTNSSNTASSTALFQAVVGGTSAGQAASVYGNGTQSWSAGLATDQTYKIAATFDTATNTAFRIFTNLTVSIPGGDFSVQRANVGNPVTSIISNTNNSNASSSAVNLISVGGTSAGDPLTTYQIAGGAAWNVGLDTSSSGSYKIAANSGLGANDTFIISTAGLVIIPMGDLNVQRSNSGATVQLLCANSSNTASSDAAIQAYVAGSSGGDPYSLYTVNGVTNFAVGIDNSDSDKFKLSASTAIGTNDCINVTTGGQVTLPQQSSFIAYPSSNAVNATGDGTVYTIVGDQYTQVGSNYNNSTGIYTAPVTGWYSFSGGILIGSIGAAHTFANCSILAGGRSYYGVDLNPFIAKDSNSDVVLTVSLAKVYLTVGQTAQFNVAVANGAKTITVSGSAPPLMYAYFCGGLVN